MIRIQIHVDRQIPSIAAEKVPGTGYTQPAQSPHSYTLVQISLTTIEPLWLLVTFIAISDHCFPGDFPKNFAVFLAMLT